MDRRSQLGLLTKSKQILVVADPAGKRIGSGGSTLYCILEILRRESASALQSGGQAWKDILRRLRILIVHAGGDSRRLPAYGPCGKIFVPVPGESDSCLPLTLFDRQLPTYLSLPEPPSGAGQVVIVSGDVLLRFDPSEVDFSQPGLTGLGCYASPEQASRHGVYSVGPNEQHVSKFLQKPTPDKQREMGIIDRYGQSVLDIGVMSFDADTAVHLLKIFGLSLDKENNLAAISELGQNVFSCGLDFYREICCGIGSETTEAEYIESARNSGSSWSDDDLSEVLSGLKRIPFQLDLLSHCDFIDFGTTAHIIRSGAVIVQQDRSLPGMNSCLNINNVISDDGQIAGANSWVEGCRIDAALTLAGRNVVVGVDVKDALELPAGACLDIIPGKGHDGCSTHFVRCYGVDDTFKTDCTASQDTFCGMALQQWLTLLSVDAGDVWDDSVRQDQRSVWNAKLFPVVDDAGEYQQWLWMFDPSGVSREAAEQWRSAKRYSMAEIAFLSDTSSFFHRRFLIHAEQIKKILRRYFHRESWFSAKELSYLLSETTDLSSWVFSLISEARWYSQTGSGLDKLITPRIIHTLASAILLIDNKVEQQSLDARLAEIFAGLPQQELDWLDSIGLQFEAGTVVESWCEQAHLVAFEMLSHTIVVGESKKALPPKSSLRSDEIVWARAPARLDTGGGWTDTPPYALEHGGCVLNIAVNLNGQPPIQAYARVIDEPVIRIASIDLGTRIQITELDELLDYKEPTSKYGLAKAALALSGFSHQTAQWPDGYTLENMLSSFGGGIELTTLAAIPKGSGLGTSSIMGAAILAAVRRLLGQTLKANELFNEVLQLEQALTTGGGWQDQIGGVLGGVKLIRSEAGIVPDANIHYLPADIADPTLNGGTTLLYYTGITRLAKNILGKVVGKYLDRDRAAAATLSLIRSSAIEVADAISSKDNAAFGRLVDYVWQLNKQLDPNSTNDEVERLFVRVGSYIHGAKLLGAGGGGFMLMVCKSAADADQVRQMLEKDPPNDRARFFDFGINRNGLVVTAC